MAKHVIRTTGELVDTLTDENKAHAIELPAKLADVTALDFTPSELAAAVAYIQAVGESVGADKLVFNGDWASNTKNFPEGYGISVIPIGKTQDVGEGADKARKRVTQFVTIAAVPTLEVLLDPAKSGAQGEQFIRDSVVSAFATKIRNAFAKGDAVSEVTLPLTVSQFIERAERGGDAGNAVFKEIGKLLRDTLKKLGVEINLQLLRSCLSSKTFAEGIMPGVSQKVWVKLLHAGVAKAKEKNLSPSIFEHWLETRDTATIEAKLDDIDI